MDSRLALLLTTSSLETGWVGSWSPGIGDPNFAGWFTVVAYLVAAYLCWRVYRRIPPSTSATGVVGFANTLVPFLLAPLTTSDRIKRTPSHQRMRGLWLGIFLLLILLGINKQLDLQTAFTELGRIAARSGGWYAIRRKFQIAFIVAVFLASAWIFRSILLLASGQRLRLAPVLVGIAFLICFVVTRAASFHHIDRLLGINFAGFKMNLILELGGIALVIYGAVGALRSVGESGSSVR
jgi:hypothetical protein